MGRIVHVVDATNASDKNNFALKSARKKGDLVIEYGGMSNGLVQALRDVITATTAGRLGPLIFYGHGAPGIQGVTMGKFGGGVAHGSAITSAWLDQAEVQASFKMLRGRFDADGVIVLRGCNIAEGNEGKDVLRRLSRIAGVPVRGSDWFQVVGRTKLVGTVHTATPDGKMKEDGWEGARNFLDLPLDEQVIVFGAEYWTRIFGH